jgi:chromosome segregation ATPase
MKKVIFICTIISAAVIASCDKTSSEYKALQAQNDSLMLANAKSASELDEILSLFNEVEENFESIKAAENYLTVQSGKAGELTASVKERVRSDMRLVTDILAKNKEKIAELEAKLNSSTLKSTQLQKTIATLRSELEGKTKTLVALNKELEHKDRQIGELKASVSALSKDVSDLSAKTDAQAQTITAQQRELTTVYYCFGTKKELKDQKILKDGQLNSTFNKEYFIREKDFNTLKIIQLKAKKGKLVSKHPDGTYEFVKDAQKKVELHILDPEAFWSITKYLVIEVDV